MVHETNTAKFIRFLVRLVFILCYIAFMWASIHHVATFFNNFEQDNGNTFGSYLLAGAFDITALVTTIGVMFFRKSMPGHIQVILWAFIIAIAGYSFIISWEYAQHFQTASLIMQPTGQTLAVYDHNNVLHYVPEMKTNDSLLYINPILASGFTIFALIYSVVAEFFGTKAPTIEELKAQQAYLEETANVLESIKEMEEKRKGKSWIAKGKDRAIEAVSAASEITNVAKTTFAKQQESERNTDELDFIKLGEAVEETSEQVPGNGVESTEKPERNERETKEESTPIWDMENLPSWLSGRGRTIRLDEVVKHTNISRKKLNNRVAKHEIRATKNAEIVYKDSLIQWLKDQGILQESVTMPSTIPAGNAEETVQQSEYIDVETAEETMPVLETIEA